MTKKQKEEALNAYFIGGMEAEEIAEKMGVTTAQIVRTLNDTALLRPYMERAKAAKLRALICVNESAEDAARKQAELMRSGEAGSAQTVSQRAAKDILDRAGVCIEHEEGREIRIRFEGMPRLGMPQTVQGGEKDA